MSLALTLLAPILFSFLQNSYNLKRLVNHTMELKSITRIDGKIRIISENSGQERVDDFEDYGLPEVDHLMKSFLEHDVVVASDWCGKGCYEFGDCYYVSYHFITIKGLKSNPYIRIGKSVTTIDYYTFIHIIYDCVNFTTDFAIQNWDHYVRLFSKKFVKQFNGRHITEQSFDKYAAVVGYCLWCLHMEVMVRCLTGVPDRLTKL